MIQGQTGIERDLRQTRRVTRGLEHPADRLRVRLIVLHSAEIVALRQIRQMDSVSQRA